LRHWNCKQGCGAGAQTFLDDWSWSRNQKLLDGGAEAGAINLGSNSTVLVCGAREFCKKYNGL